MKDVFRPTQPLPRVLYDAFQKESEHRKGRSPEEWCAAEEKAVWAAARDYAQQHELRVPTLEEIQTAARSAEGHVDFAAKWAYAIVDLMAEE